MECEARGNEKLLLGKSTVTSSIFSRSVPGEEEEAPLYLSVFHLRWIGRSVGGPSPLGSQTLPQSVKCQPTQSIGTEREREESIPLPPFHLFVPFECPHRGVDGEGRGGNKMKSALSEAFVWPLEALCFPITKLAKAKVGGKTKVDRERMEGREKANHK